MLKWHLMDVLRDELKIIFSYKDWTEISDNFFTLSSSHILISSTQHRQRRQWWWWRGEGAKKLKWKKPLDVWVKGAQSILIMTFSIFFIDHEKRVFIAVLYASRKHATW